MEKRRQYKQKEVKNVYSRSLNTINISLPVNVIGKNLEQTIENTIISMIEGKCIVEGYVKKGSIKVITYSSGIVKGNNVIFEIVYECDICFPVAGMKLNCIAKNITKAGIRAESSETEDESPFVLFVARDHHFSNEYFNSIKENDKFVAKVIAQRFELNDKYISIIAEIVAPKEKNYPFSSKPRLTL